MLPVTALVFLAYGYYGALLDRVGLDLIAHRGYSIARLVGTLYMTLEGIFGVPLDVTATYIILFTIYGAILEYSGAGRFFVDWTMAAIGRSGDGAGPGRTVTVAGYLLGAVSGSGVANTVMLGSITWPLMRRAGYPPRRRRRGAGVGRHRRDPGAAGHGRRRVSHRRVPAHLVSAGHRDGGDSGAAVLHRRSS